MKLGTMIKPTPESVRWARKIGCQCVELYIFPLLPPPPIDSQGLQEALTESSLTCSLHADFTSLLAHEDQIVRKELREYGIRVIELAAYLGAEIVTVHPAATRAIAPFDLSRVPRGKEWLFEAINWRVSPHFDESFALTVEAFRFLSTAAAREGITLALENLDRSPHLGRRLGSLDDIEAILLAVSSPHFKACLDLCHAYGTDPGDWLNRLGDKIVNVHASDAYHHANEHLPIGSGAIDWDAVGKGLARIGYQRSVVLEVLPYENTRV
ncbi:MAG: sugar phosphate isomerase/epimerase, partial [Chloroflexi bacterium]|nr:sugar phosphate isomerase/epimerase [Chloroflexota bacterium]